MSDFSRRTFLQASLTTAVASSLLASEGRPPRILLRSSWQMVNIGDIAHTPGVIALLEKHLPAAEVTLWASASHSEEVAAMEQRRFPKLHIVKGSIGDDGRASTAELQAAIDKTDLLLHGSGPSLVGAKDVAAFVKHVQKPFGVYGITYGGGNPDQRDLLGKARFVFFRDSVSLEKAKEERIACAVMEFGPDGAFAVDLRDDERAEAFLKAHDLEAGKFLCCIGRLRTTPYWKIRGKDMTETDKRNHANNERMKEHDHAPLRAAIEAVARQTDLKVLICPEDVSQMAVGKEMLFDPLPDDVKKSVVWREKFWLTDEALSTYVRSAGLFGNEMHSPIMCIGNGVPALVCRWRQQTSKGLMWRDIGLGDWLFDMDNDQEIPGIAPAVLAMAKDSVAARQRVAAAQKVVQRRQRETMEVVAKNVLPS